MDIVELVELVFELGPGVVVHAQEQKDKGTYEITKVNNQEKGEA